VAVLGVTRLETERLLLRPPTLDDAERAGELLGDPEVMRFIGGTAPPEAWEGIVERWLVRWEANGFGPFIVERRDDGRFVGRVGMHVWDTRTWVPSTWADAGDFGQPELGWALARAMWGSGYATEAARAVQEWVQVESLVSVIAPANVASQRVAEKLGGVPAETVRLFDTGDAVVWRYA
jgi:RimJ/RimL family protein N-acetyltransferase